MRDTLPDPPSSFSTTTTTPPPPSPIITSSSSHTTDTAFEGVTKRHVTILLPQRKPPQCHERTLQILTGKVREPKFSNKEYRNWAETTPWRRIHQDRGMFAGDSKCSVWHKLKNFFERKKSQLINRIH